MRTTLYFQLVPVPLTFYLDLDLGTSAAETRKIGKNEKWRSEYPMFSCYGQHF